MDAGCPCDFCNAMVASPLAAAVLAAMLPCKHCAAKANMSIDRSSSLPPLPQQVLIQPSDAQQQPNLFPHECFWADPQRSHISPKKSLRNRSCQVVQKILVNCPSNNKPLMSPSPPCKSENCHCLARIVVRGFAAVMMRCRSRAA